MYIQARATNGSPASDYYLRHRSDDIVHAFVEHLLPTDKATKVLRGLYTSALHSAVVQRLASLRQQTDQAARGRLNPLPKWRLKRVEEFVGANLDDLITLHTLAAVAGVSRMHFAAQFREATGMRPHDYVLGLRISAARNMLAGPLNTIVDIALCVGFQTQSHFTTVFKNRAGLTPNRYRRAVLAGF